MKIYGYIRVSHRRSRDRGNSPRGQRRAIETYAARHYPGVEIIWLQDLAVSGRSVAISRRREGNRLYDEPRSGDVVIATEVDRLARNLLEYAKFGQHCVDNGIAMEFVNGGDMNANAGSRLQFGILAAIAQYQSDIISNRTKEAFAIKKLRLESKSQRKPTKGNPIANPYFAKDIEVISHAHQVGRTFGYVRCSHIDSLKSGLGLEHQEHDVEVHGERLGDWQGSERDEAVSAFRVPFFERNGVRRILDKIAPGDTIVVYRIDRAWRNLRECLNSIDELKKRGIGVYICESNINTLDPSSELEITALGMAAQMESRFLSMSTSRALAELKRAGCVYCRSIPIDAKVEVVENSKHLVPDMDKIAFLLWIEELRVKDGMSWQALSKMLARHCGDMDYHPRHRYLVYKNGEEVYWTKRRLRHAIEQLPEIKDRLERNGVDLPEPDGSWLSSQQLKLREKYPVRNGLVAS